MGWQALSGREGYTCWQNSIAADTLRIARISHQQSKENALGENGAMARSGACLTCASMKERRVIGGVKQAATVTASQAASVVKHQRAARHGEIKRALATWLVKRQNSETGAMKMHVR